MDLKKYGGGAIIMLLLVSSVKSTGENKGLQNFHSEYVETDLQLSWLSNTTMAMRQRSH